MSYVQSKNKKVLNKKIIVVIIVIAILLIVGGLYFFSHKDEKSSDSISGDMTTSTTQTANENFNDGDYREPGNSIAEDEGSGEISDNNGSIDESVNTSDPIISQSGEITLYTPKNDSSIKSGFTVAGKSTLPQVSYRLIDSVSGVIASGEISVVSGNFSGTLSFITNATEGRLDIYGTREDLTEFSNIEVPIRFVR